MNMGFGRSFSEDFTTSGLPYLAMIVLGSMSIIAAEMAIEATLRTRANIRFLWVMFNLSVLLGVIHRAVELQSVSDGLNED